MMRLFDRLEIETLSLCNRRCPTCLRNSEPDRRAVAGYFERNELPTLVVLDLLDQAAALGFRGAVVLSWHNEPLLDPRLPEFARYAKGLGVFSEIFICTNGDRLTPQLAAELDGQLDNIRIALYDFPGRGPEMRSWFRQTHVTLTGGRHIPRHYTLGAPVHPHEPCEMESQMRCAIAHDGTLRMCCEDITGRWHLGSIHERPLEDLWFGEPHRRLVEALQHPGGRFLAEADGYCLTCPQMNVPYWSVGFSQPTSGDR